MNKAKTLKLFSAVLAALLLWTLCACNSGVETQPTERASEKGAVTENEQTSNSIHTNSAQTTDGATERQTGQADNPPEPGMQYPITYNDNAKEFVLECPESGRPGTQITLRTGIILDADIAVFLLDRETNVQTMIPKNYGTDSDGNYTDWRYTFEMPGYDASLEVVVYGSKALYDPLKDLQTLTIDVSNGTVKLGGRISYGGTYYSSADPAKTLRFGVEEFSLLCKMISGRVVPTAPPPVPMTEHFSFCCIDDSTEEGKTVEYRLSTAEGMAELYKDGAFLCSFTIDETQRQSLLAAIGKNVF